jgi:hypothetical protein
MAKGNAAPKPPTFRVEVDVRGLCMFVRGKDSKGKDVVHVLMPKTGGRMPGMPSMLGNGKGHKTAGGSNGQMPTVMQHIPRVVYSLDYEPQPNPSIPVFNEGVANLERVIGLPNGTVIDWSTKGVAKDAPAENTPDPLAQLIDITSLVKEAGGTAQDADVLPSLLSGPLPANGPCAVRITLPGSVQITPYNFRVHRFGIEDPDPRVPPKPKGPGKLVAACALCVFEMTTPTLAFTAETQRQLVHSSGVVRVMFGNTIASDYAHPPIPLEPEGQRTHFWGFYPLIANAPKRPSVPDVPGGLGAPSTTCTIVNLGNR